MLLHASGWIDDWIIAAASAEDMQRLLLVWEKVLLEFGWELHPAKTELMAVTCSERPVQRQGQHLSYVSSFEWLGCTIAASGTATQHLRMRAGKTVGAWRILCHDFDFNRLSFNTKAKLDKSVLEPI